MSPEALLHLEQTSYDVLGAAVSNGMVRSSRLRPSPVASISNRGGPNWLGIARLQLAELQQLPRNWDSYGASPISSDSTSAAFEILLQIATDRTPLPSIVPSSDGTIQLEWHTAGCDLEVRLVGQARIHISFEDSANPDDGFDDELRFDLTRLREAITRISE